MKRQVYNVGSNGNRVEPPCQTCMVDEVADENQGHGWDRLGGTSGLFYLLIMSEGL